MITNRPDLSVVIPAYNEEHRIGPTLVALDHYLSGSGLSYEILVVDDGSTDGTVPFVRGLSRGISRTRPALRCIESRPNRGKGSVVRLGMLAARGAVRVMYDADGAVPPDQLPKIVNPVRTGGADIAIGSRYADGADVQRKQPFYRVWWSRLANAVVQRTVIPGVFDTQCGFKAFSAEAARHVFRRTRVDGWAFDLEALALAHRFGFRIEEVAVTWADDPRSNINPLADAFRVVRELLTIRRNLRKGVYDGRPFPLRPARTPSAA
jgi:glycosyltransferase involved in cell wall biosynthesis